MNKIIDKPLYSESWQLLRLAIPIIATGILESSPGFLNTFFAAQLGHEALAINAVVSILFTTIMVIFWGLISATSICIAHYHGAQNTQAISGVIRDSIITSLILSLPVMLLLWYADDILLWLGQPASIVHTGRDYLHALTWAVPADFIGFVLMQFFQGLSKPKITFIVSLVYVPLNIGVNYVLVFGKFGIPALGLAGIGWGTTAVYTIILIAISAYIYFQPQYHCFFQFKNLPKQQYFKELFRIGLPLGTMYSIEIAYFFVLALLMGKVSDIALAGNQIVVQYFMIVMSVVFGFGQAVSIRIGWRMGKKESHWIPRITLGGQLLAAVYIFSIAIIYRVYPAELTSLDFDHHQIAAISPVISVAVSLFKIVALAQIVEAIRIIFFCVLRGIKDTRFTLITSTFTFWGIALPLGYYLAFILHPGNPAGLWQGFIISQIIGSIILASRLVYKLKGLKVIA